MMTRWSILVCVAYSMVIIKCRESIEPDLNQEIYTSSQASNATYFKNQYIECGSAICEVRCDINAGCHNLTVNASLSTSLIIDCNQIESCTQLSVIAPLNVYIYCTATDACAKAQIYAQSTSNINMECLEFHSCSESIIMAETVTDELNIKCINDDSCYASDIHCPSAQTANCNIQCLNEQSCKNMNFFIDNAVNNTLNLECSNITGCTGIIHCANGYYQTSNFVQSATPGDIYCNPHNAGCCPFVEDTIVCVTGSDCVVDCSNRTCVGYHIDATNANSLTLQCDVGYGCAEALIECPIGGDALCNITCNSCNTAFIKASANFSLSCTTASGCVGMLLSLEGNLNQIEVNCVDYQACYNALIISEQEASELIHNVSIKCTGERTCYNMKIDLQMNAGSNDTIDEISDEFSLICTGSNYVCYGLDLSFVGNIDKVYIQCGIRSKSDSRACNSNEIVHRGTVINTLEFMCYGDDAFNYGDIYLYTKEIGVFVWDCLSHENISSYSACDRAYLELEASVDQFNLTCMGYFSCYDAEFSFGTSTSTNTATIDRWNLRCIEDEVDRWGDGDYACIYADIIAYSGKTINYVDIECNGGNMGCLNTMTKVYGNAHINDWNMNCYNHSWNCEWVYFLIYDSASISHANVNCYGDKYVCYGIWFDGGTDTVNAQEFIYNCNSPNVCEGGDIDGDWFSSIDLTLNCNDVNACKDFQIEPSVGKLNLNCNDTNACINMQVDCAYLGENMCHIECSTDDGSCKNIAIATYDPYPYGYLDLHCPSPEIYTNNTACDGITIECERYTSKLPIEYIYDYTMHEYICSNDSDIYCCPWNGISSNPTNQPTPATFNPTIDPTLEPTFIPTVGPTHNPTMEPSEIPTSAPTMEPSEIPTSAPTQPSSAPTFTPTVPTQAPSVPIVYPLNVEMEVRYDFDDIPLYLLMDIIEQTLDYVLNTTDLPEWCELTDDDLSVVKTESGIKIEGEILTCLDEPPSILIAYFKDELKAELISNINVGTNLIVTEDDIRLDVDVINPFPPSISDDSVVSSFNPTYAPKSNYTQKTDHTQRNIMAVIGGALFLIGCIVLYVYRQRRTSQKRAGEAIQEIAVEIMETTTGDNATDAAANVNVSEAIEDDYPALPTAETKAGDNVTVATTTDAAVNVNVSEAIEDNYPALPTADRQNVHVMEQEKGEKDVAIVPEEMKDYQEGDNINKMDEAELSESSGDSLFTKQEPEPLLLANLSTGTVEGTSTGTVEGTSSGQGDI